MDSKKHTPGPWYVMDDGEAMEGRSGMSDSDEFLDISTPEEILEEKRAIAEHNIHVRWVIETRRNNLREFMREYAKWLLSQPADARYDWHPD